MGILLKGGLDERVKMLDSGTTADLWQARSFLQFSPMLAIISGVKMG